MCSHHPGGSPNFDVKPCLKTGQGSAHAIPSSLASSSLNSPSENSIAPKPYGLSSKCRIPDDYHWFIIYHHQPISSYQLMYHHIWFIIIYQCLAYQCFNVYYTMIRFDIPNFYSLIHQHTNSLLMFLLLQQPICPFKMADWHLGSIQEFHKVDPLGVALLHTLKSLRPGSNQTLGRSDIDDRNPQKDRKGFNVSLFQRDLRFLSFWAVLK